MKAMLISFPGGSSKVNGTRMPSILIQKNGLLENLKSILLIYRKKDNQYQQLFIYIFLVRAFDAGAE